MNQPGDHRSWTVEQETSPTLPEPSPSYCATHPRVETSLRCSRCAKPICPRCLVHTPVGARCRACARMQRLPVFDARPRDLAAGLGAGLGVGLVGGAVISIPWLGYLFLALGIGYLVGQAVSAAANRPRAKSLAVVAAASAGVGIIFGPLLLAAMQAPWMLLSALWLRVALAALTEPLGLLTIGLAGLLAWYQVR